MRKREDYRRDAKVLFFDLEVSPTLGWTYGQYQADVIKVEQPPILLAFSWKWLGEHSKPHGMTLLDTKQVGAFDDYEIVRKLWELLDEAEVVVAHNGARFDSKMANTFFLRHNMKPPTPYKVFDTLQTARRFFKFDNNKLDYLGKLLSGEGKTEVTYGGCWYDMLYGDKKTRKKKADLMDKYCRQDTAVLESVYLKILPWATNHPNMALCANQEQICPRCGFASHFKIKSYRKTGVQVNAIQLQCKRCGGYVTRPLSPEEKEEYELHGCLKPLLRNTNA